MFFEKIYNFNWRFIQKFGKIVILLMFKLKTITRLIDVEKINKRHKSNKYNNEREIDMEK